MFDIIHRKSGEMFGAYTDEYLDALDFGMMIAENYGIDTKDDFFNNFEIVEVE